MEYSRIKFYISYLFYKLIIPIEVKEGGLNIWIAEVIWIFNNIFKKNMLLPAAFKKEYFETKYGKFFITPDVISLVTVSPAFERLDTDEMERKIVEELGKDRNVLFIDIGAYFGDYSIRVGNRFRKYKRFKIYAFEPGTEYLSSSTLKQLKKNIKLNKLKNVRIFPFGIGSKTQINELGILVKPLNRAIPNVDYSKYDTVFIKLDIDDYVIDGLKGIEQSVNKFNKVYLLVEDFVKPKQTKSYLEKNNYKLIKKLTPYNSFWIKK